MKMEDEILPMVTIIVIAKGRKVCFVQSLMSCRLTYTRGARLLIHATRHQKKVSMSNAILRSNVELINFTIQAMDQETELLTRIDHSIQELISIRTRREQTSLIML